MARFTKGNQAAKGHGRPKGSTHKYAAYNDLVKEDMPKLIKRMMKDAISGDNIAAKIIMDRAWVISTIQMQMLEAEMTEIRQLVSEAANESK